MRFCAIVFNYLISIFTTSNIPKSRASYCDVTNDYERRIHNGYRNVISLKRYIMTNRALAFRDFTVK